MEDSPPPDGDPPPTVTLEDLPDEILELIARACHAVARPRGGGVAWALLATSRRLRDIAYEAVTSISVRSRSTADECAAVGHRAAPGVDALADPLAFFLSPPGAALQARVRGVHQFLARARRVREVALHPNEEHDGGWLPDPEDWFLDRLFYALVLPELRRLPLVSLSAAGVGVAVLGGGPMSAAPLRKLVLEDIEEDHVDAAIVSVLGHHGGSLEELTLARTTREDEDTNYMIGPWLAASAGMPRLRTLELHVEVDAAAAAALARHCPGLTRLAVNAALFDGVAAALRGPRRLPALAHLGWAFYERSTWGVGAELRHLLAGRALTSLSLSAVPSIPRDRLDVLPALLNTAALPAELDVSGMAPLGDAALAALAAAGHAGSLRRLDCTLSAGATAAALRSLGRLTGLTDLTLRLPAAPDAAALRLSEWPVRGLTRLHVVGTDAVGCPTAAQALLVGVAASCSRSTLRGLFLSGPPLEEAVAAAPLAALTALRCLYYGVPYASKGETVEALHARREAMNAWIRRRLPDLRTRPLASRRR